MQRLPLDFEVIVKREVKSHPHASQMVKLAFPSSTSFLHDLSSKEMNRIIRLGWDLPKSIHLGMPYFGAYPPAYEPTYSMLGLIILPEKTVYFRCVAWNASFLEKAHDISVEESVYHEQLHITKDVEPRFRKAVPLDWENQLELGREIKSESVFHVVHKYGRRAEDILEADALKRYREQARGKTILGNVLAFWLRRYFLEKFDKYKEQSFELTPELKSDKVFQSIKRGDLATKEMYGERFGHHIEEPMLQ